MRSGSNSWKTRQRVWTKEKLDWLIESKNKYHDREDILNEFNIHFGTILTLKKLSFVNCHYDLKLPKSKNILKKNIKEQRRLLFGRDDMNIGDEFTRNGEMYVKISNIPKEKHNNYILKKRYMYEKYHNIKLNDDDCIVFLNGNHNDFSKDNLYRISNSINGYLVGHGINNVKKDKLAVIKFCEWKEKINKMLERT